MKPRALLALAVLVLALAAAQAPALSAEDTRTSEKAAVDKYGYGTGYTFSTAVKNDPYHITRLLEDWKQRRHARTPSETIESGLGDLNP